MPIKDFYNTSPADLKPGDVLVCVVTLHVQHTTQHDGDPYFRMYRCAYPPETGQDDIPQGTRIYTDENSVAKALFPVALNAGMFSEG